MILLALNGGVALPCDACDNGVCDERGCASLCKLLPFNSFSLLFLFLSKFLLPKDDSKMSSGLIKCACEGVQFF